MHVTELKQKFRTALAKDYGPDYEITARECESDRFDGVEFVVSGDDYIPVVPVLDVIREDDCLFAENIGSSLDEDGARLIFFVVEADLSPAGKATFSEMDLA